MTEFVPFPFEQDTLSEWTPAAAGEPIPAHLNSKVTQDCKDTPLDTKLFHLQLASARAGADLSALEPAMQRLLELLSTPTSEASIEAEAEAWWLEIGPVPLDQELITINRNGYLLGAMRPNEEGRLIASSFRPLDAHTLRLLTRLSARPHPRHGVAMRSSNWEYALDSAVTADNFYASNHDLPYLTHRASGIWGQDIEAHPAAHTAMQLDIFSKLNGTNASLLGARQDEGQIALAKRPKKSASEATPKASAARQESSSLANAIPDDSSNIAMSYWWTYR